MSLFYFRFTVFIAVVALFANTACATHFEKSSIATNLENVALDDAEELLSGHLRDVVCFSEIDDALEYVETGVRGDVELLLEKIDSILLTSYGERSKEYRLNCNFLQISIYLRSLSRNFDEMEACGKACRDDELKRLRSYLEYDYLDLRGKVGLCRAYLKRK